jgi:hypothetical protein
MDSDVESRTFGLVAGLGVGGHTLIERENLDAIVLAGTDLAFVFDQANTDFPHVDGARLHVDAIMREILRQT